MTALAVIGFLALLVVALYLSVATVGSFIGSLGLTGRVDPVVYFFAVLATAAWWACIDLWPFSITLKAAS